MSFPDGLTGDDVFACLRRLLLASQIVPLDTRLPLIRHECSSACDFFVSGIMHVCIASNNVHFCSLTACNRLVSDAETQVCEITACCYGLDMAAVPAYYDCAKREKPNDVRGDADSRIQRRTREHTEDGSNRTETFNLLRKVLEPLRAQPEDKSLASLVDLPMLMEVCERLWFLCTETRHYRSQPCRYRHRYHVLVVLYASIKGITVETRRGKTEVLVPHNEHIKRHLPPFKTLPRRIKGLDVNTFTKTNKIFLACMRELHA